MFLLKLQQATPGRNRTSRRSIFPEQREGKISWGRPARKASCGGESKNRLFI